MLRGVIRNLSRPKPNDPLQAHIDWYVQQGYRVVSQTEASAQLVKPKAFSFVWALLWFLLLGVGLIVYLLYYASKRDKTVYLTVADGAVAAR
jgi:uncharacterized membrane protein